MDFDKTYMWAKLMSALAWLKQQSEEKNRNEVKKR